MKNYTTEEMRQLRARGFSNHQIAKKLGCVASTVTRRLNNDVVGVRHVRRSYAAKTDAIKLMREIPQDTRNFTAQFFGDPLPGRSALDKRGEL